MEQNPSFGQAIHPLDSRMYGAGFGSPRMAAVFTEKNVQQRRLDAEVALIQAQEETSLVPSGIAGRVKEAAKLDEGMLESMCGHFGRTQNDIVALVRALGERCLPEDREYLHYGATSQDIHISGMALLLKEAVEILEDAIGRLEATLAKRALEHRDTIMAGRTHGQQALPITFGYKVALWLSDMSDHKTRLRELSPRLLVGHMKGAVGSHAGFGAGVGFPLEKRVMQILGLGCSPVNLQPSEERYMEFLNWLALVCATCGRICFEVRALHRTETAEVREAFESGSQIGSSAMPHKRNPESSETLQGVAYKVQSNAGCMLRVWQEHERDATRNANEHLLIGESCILSARILEGVREMVRTMEVDPGRMKRNLEQSRSLILSEPVMMALAKKTGRKETAHHIVYECALRAHEEGRDFREILREDSRVSEHLTDDELSRILKPELHTGTCGEQVDQAVRRVRQDS